MIGPFLGGSRRSCCRPPPDPMRNPARSFLALVFLSISVGPGGVGAPPGFAQEETGGPTPPPRGSIVEDRAAKKLIEAGDTRLEAEETEKALEIWRSVIERYPRSRVRFDAHLRLGDFLLTQKRAYDEARGHFEAASDEANPDDEQRAEATLRTGICFYEGRFYGQCFKVLREVIEVFPNSGHVNEAYYYIGLGHFKLGHYSRAIEALEKVGTAFSGDDTQVEKVEAGKRLFVKIDDHDLAILEPGESVKVICQVASGDQEIVECHPIGRQVRVVLGSIPTVLGRPVPGNGLLEVRGGDKIDVVYTDAHTADRQFNQQRLFSVDVVGSALVQITDGTYESDLAGVVIGKQANVQVIDADFDRTDEPDKLTAMAEIWRQKTEAEIDEEIAALAASGELPDPEDPEAEKPKIERFKKIDEVRVTLTEIKQSPPLDATNGAEESTGAGEGEPGTDTAGAVAAEAANDPAAAVPDVGEPPRQPTEVSLDPDGAPGLDVVAEAESLVAEIENEKKNDPTFHSGVFRGTVPVADAGEPVGGDALLQARPGDRLRLRFQDEVNLSRTAQELVADAECIEGNLGNVRVTKTDISDAELKIKTRLRTAEALTNIGNHYKEFGLKVQADAKYGEALEVAEEILADARKLGGAILEQAYVQLWRTYFAMEQFNLAVAMSQRLMREFPESTFVDEAMLQQAHAYREQGNLGQAINLYSSVLRLNNSPLKGEAQFGVAETYEQMAADAGEQQSLPLYERAFVEYQKVYEQFPESGRVGDAVAKMANFYYQKEDYARAVDVFENVLSDYPDANFLDVILFNYGRCLYRLERRAEARRMFDQLINEFPESDLATEAKRISEALVKSGF